MGLDNGIYVKQKGDFNKEEVPNYVKLEYYASEPDTAYVCYWRKCWNIRGFILDKIDDVCDENKDYELSITNIDEIINIIVNYLDGTYSWDDEDFGGSIWTFEEIIPILAQDIVNLGWLKAYLMTHPQAVAYFYDSY
ncbi:MAG: hypothetical protein IJH65_10930 [Methanobrevibacter sp.]|nr:hypothetical protein [Methanobrevibacter sp.]